MAKKRRTETNSNGGSVQGYFRAIFQENPQLLKQRSNDTLYERWLKDHPGQKEVPERVRQGLSNLKSVLRKRMKIRRRLRKAEEAAAAGPTGGTPGRKPAGLTLLEASIDEALTLAKHIDRNGLSDIIQLLRSARNRVIVRLG